ncbi:Alpha/Beta hydrolase protein [Dendryphion nanum]|uniref:Alpha/Beta hydrolase protein n=1 Tax=Dendryphion nanum TaxID=256645 RepID=A0A9P9D9E0_9PLEO|nr:Alpha/Beta hydrolase protein [Dendryphion nanum]
MKLLPTILSLLSASTVLAADRCTGGSTCTDPDVIRLNTTSCQKYHIFTARGSNAQKPGHAADLIRQVCTNLGGDCNFEDIDFPARGGGNGWCESASLGATNGVKQLKSYAERCPDAGLIVVGFSQGASVSLDYLGGGGGVNVFGCDQPENEGLNRSSVAGGRVLAALLFGSTVRAASTNYTIGGGRAFNGTAARPQRYQNNLAAFAAAGVLREYCNEGDPICAVGSTPSDMSNHLSYFERYTNESVKWVVETVQKNSAKASASASVSPSATPSATPGAGNQGNVPETSDASPRTSIVLSGARGTWGFCGVVVLGTFFFLFA